MPYELFLAMRYLSLRHKRSLTQITAFVAVVGIAIGVAALIVALALANGFRDEMRDKILRGTAHVTVMRSDGQPMNDYQELALRIKKIAGVLDAAGTTYDGAIIVGSKGSAYAVLRGIDSDSNQAELGRSLISGEVKTMFASDAAASGPTRVVIGAELATRCGLELGDRGDIIPAGKETLTGAAVIKRAVRVVGIFRSGLFEYDSTWIYLPLERAAEFAGATHAAAVISVQVNDIYTVKQVSDRLRTTLGNSYTVLDWQEANRPLFTALSLERRMSLFIIALIIFIAALNITTTLILVVVDRSRDIAIVSAMGATSRSIMMIFVIEGAVISASGIVVGVIIGFLACLIGNRYRFVSLPGDVYSISYVPFNMEVRDVLIAAVVAFALSLVATIYPARAAARVPPVEMLRDAL